jgi:putative membrane protein
MIAMIRRLLATTAILAAGLLAAPAAFAQAAPPNAPGPAVSGTPAPRALPSAQDKDFVNQAGAGGLAEVELSKVAEKSANPDVKRFAERMVTDHTKADAQLSAIAGRIGAGMPTTPDSEHQRIRDSLAQTHGAAFDQRYMRVMVEDHDQAVKLFQHEAGPGHSPELTRFAQQTLPVLREHQRMAIDLSHHLWATAAR